jgi:hypothetical protein
MAVFQTPIVSVSWRLEIGFFRKNPISEPSRRVKKYLASSGQPQSIEISALGIRLEIGFFRKNPISEPLRRMKKLNRDSGPIASPTNIPPLNNKPSGNPILDYRWAELFDRSK